MNSVDEFWKSREEELGTAILYKTLGRMIQSNSRIPIWGVLYTTVNAVYFQTFESESWISSLISRKNARKKTEDKTIEIPASSLIQAEITRPKKTILKLFSQLPIVRISWYDTNSNEKQILLIEIVGNAEVLVSSVPGNSLT